MSIPLNKYLSNAGICSRRKAVEYIKKGLVTVNGIIIKEPGYKVILKDKVAFKNRIIKGEQKLYMLINKPKDYITTTVDPKGRRTVIDLIRGNVNARIYPVGRLDRMTTGVLLLTNDGDLAQKLAHPKYEVKKIYSVRLDRPLKSDDLTAVYKGIVLKDGLIKADKINYIAGKNKNHIRIQIHSGKNRVVRRIFEHLGYKVLKLDRINYAGLTKRGLPIGRWRSLTATEVTQLKAQGETERKEVKKRKDKK